MENSFLKAASFTPISLQLPAAWIGHIPFAAWLIQAVSPRVFVELGSHSGNSYFSFCQSVCAANLTTKCFAVDTWAGDEHAGYYGDEVFKQVNNHNIEHYAGFSNLLRMTFDEALEQFEDGSIDLLHIDGLHSYEAVKHDFESWLPKLTQDALVLFHDTNVRECDFGVWKLWRELQSIYPLNIEFEHSSGLGVLQVSDDLKMNKIPWLASDNNKKQEIKSFFKALGLRQIERFEISELRTELKDKAKQEQQLHQRNLEVQEKEQQLHQRNLEVQEKEQQLHQKDQQLHQRNLEVQGKDQQLHQRNLEVQEKDQQLHQRNLEVQEKDQQLHQRNLEVLEKEQQLHQRNLEVLEKEQQLDELLSSIAWKVSLPVRWLESKLKK